MSFIPAKKSAYVLSLMMMFCYSFKVFANEPAAAQVTGSENNAAGIAPAVPAAPLTTPQTPETAAVTAEAPAPALPDVTPPATPDAQPAAPADAVTTLPLTHATAEPEPEPEPVKEPAAEVAPEPEKVAFSLNSEEQKRAYASGVAMAKYIEAQIVEQKALHITLDKDILLAGITDTFNQREKMSPQDVQATLTAFDEQVKILTQAATAKEQGAEKAFIEEFAKRPGVKKTAKGLYYLVENKGEGAVIKDTNQVEVTYKGELLDGTMVDGPQIDNANQIFRVADMPPVLRDAVKLVRKGGKVTIVIPPAAVGKNSEEGKPKSVVIYTVSVVNVNNPH
ncbi:FKBP-type peptidyl-prolyl cis-trans isomerase N-terminal domain-containing protein [Rahnella sp. R3(2024)]|uniref:FKBP-type peptidyl-prolyl cis-trans isomerase N-terminal domain-containing protein n=1 Tax=Rahnella sp. R3(2024) TaxID=3163550 RepID=UPI0036E88A7B